MKKIIGVSVALVILSGCANAHKCNDWSGLPNGAICVDREPNDEMQRQFELRCDFLNWKEVNNQDVIFCGRIVDDFPKWYKNKGSKLFKN